MSEANKLLTETLRLFESFGVISGRGVDGKLMEKIINFLATTEGAAPPSLASTFNPNMRSMCPLCHKPDFNECGCPADQQMAALLEKGMM